MAQLKLVWKDDVKKKMRASALADLHFAQDPFHFLAIDIHLDRFLRDLRATIEQGRYASEVSIIIRAAKTKGLVRPLAFLSARDALIYRAIISHGEASLLLNNRPWTGFRHSDKGATREGNDGDSASDSFDWFSFWLRSQGQTYDITQRCPYVVETDISNFFASIDLEVVREHLLANAGLPKDAVRLCMHLIQQVSPRPRHSTFPAQGLPQENQDSSRTIAHSLLSEIDDTLEEYGKAGNYVRYMDDMLVGVQSVNEGERVIRTIQLALEEIGLHPNTAKTNITASADYIEGLCPEENGFLDKAQKLIDGHRQGETKAVTNLPLELVEEIETRATRFRDLAGPERPVRWDRVLRRYYTILRNIRSRLFLSEPALVDISRIPSGARGILEYIRAFPISESSVRELFAIAIGWHDLYEDLALAIYETIVSAPNDGSASLRSTVVNETFEAIRCLPNQGLRPEFSDIATSSLYVLLGKFGSPAEIGSLEAHWDSLERGSSAWMQGLVILTANGTISEATLDGPAPAMSWTTAQNWSIVRALLRGDRKTASQFLGLVSPVLRLQPLRQYVHPRALVAAPLLDRAGELRWPKVRETLRTRLAENPLDLRDTRSIDMLDKQ